MIRCWSNSAAARDASGGPHRRAQSGVADELLDRGGDGHRVADGNEQAGHTVGDHLATAADVGGDGRQTHRGGLHGAAREPLAPARGDEDVGIAA